MEKNKARLYGFPRDQVPNVWAEVVPWIRKGLDVNAQEANLLDIYVDLLARKKQLWLVIKGDELIGSGLSKIETEEGGAVICWIYTFAGKSLLPDLPDMLRQFELWAKANGRHVLRIAGRPGWAKVFRDWTRHTDSTGAVYLEKIL